MASTPPLPISPDLDRNDAAAGQAVWLTLAAVVAVVLPTLIAFNVSPSATFFNQAAAFVGWGGFLLLLVTLLPSGLWPRSRASLALIGALALLVIAAIGSAAVAMRPWSLSLSEAGTILSALLVVAVAASLARAGLAEPSFRAFCVALVVAGIASSVIGLVQVFAPTLPDGDWVALSAIPGRATGNLRQPNHLSSLLLWSIVAAVWLAESMPRFRIAAAALVVLFIYVIVLSASRTGAVGMLTLAGWGIFDRRLSGRARVLLILAPILYGAGWWGTTVWANASHHLFGGQTRFGGSGDISSSRFGIWSNTLSLIAMHPLLGVGFGEFNFAWTLTPFPHRPVAFFDHTHNIVLNFLVELGIPLAVLVLGLMTFALWHALKNAIADGRHRLAGGSGRAASVQLASVPIQRAALVMVVMVAVHSMLEYPLWYSYFLAAGCVRVRPVPRAARAFEGSPLRCDATGLRDAPLCVGVDGSRALRHVVGVRLPARLFDLRAADQCQPPGESASPMAERASSLRTTPTMPPRPSTTSPAR